MSVRLNNFGQTQLQGKSFSRSGSLLIRNNACRVEVAETARRSLIFSSVPFLFGMSISPAFGDTLDLRDIAKTTQESDHVCSNTVLNFECC